ncbi:hypothetical protein FA13DRAFT_1777470, partial [Coprinellus micaceus]
MRTLDLGSPLLPPARSQSSLAPPEGSTVQPWASSPTLKRSTKQTPLSKLKPPGVSLSRRAPIPENRSTCNRTLSRSRQALLKPTSPPPVCATLSEEITYVP